MAIILSDDFTGTDGAAWNASNWEAAVFTSGGLRQIQTNRGRLQSSGAAYALARSTANLVSVGDIDVTFSYGASGTTERYIGFWYRFGGYSGSIPASCYLVEFDVAADAVYFEEVDAG